jgi:hypothetical protein
MVKSIGMAGLAAALMFGALVPIDAAQATSAVVPAARKHVRHYAYATRPYYPSYYGRPTVYEPAPFVPVPPFFGYGWEWW